MNAASAAAALAARMAEARDELCRLDGAIGDGDHGLAMASGFAAAAVEPARPLAEIFQDMRAAAHAGAQATVAMTATKGRAARLGARSLGHIDPGAASAAIIVDTLTRRWGEEADQT